MKIIDLLQRIANGEEKPKKIKILSDNEVYEYNYDFDYIGENGDELFGECLANVMNIHIFLNEEVEIIEEEKKIEPIKYEINKVIGLSDCIDKINEIIDYINKGDK